jgi:hypothetical protein
VLSRLDWSASLRSDKYVYCQGEIYTKLDFLPIFNIRDLAISYCKEELPFLISSLCKNTLLYRSGIAIAVQSNGIDRWHIDNHCSN